MEFRLAFSATATFVTVLPMTFVLFYSTDNPLVFLSLPPAFIIYYIIAERFLEGAAGFVVRFLELGDKLLSFAGNFDDDFDPEEINDSSLDFPDEHLLYVWGLANSIQNEITPTKRFSIYVIVIDDGYPVEIYPYPNEQGSMDLDESAFSLEKVFKAEIRNNRTVLVYVPLDIFEILGRACERGDGEKIKINDEKEALALFSLTKILASTLGSQDERINSYIAYKTVLKLKKKGLLLIDDSYIDSLPLGDSRTKFLIKRQVNEELGLKKV